MSASAERTAERKSIRKAAALAWQKEHRGLSPRANMFKLRNDDQDEEIPRHGRRGKGRIPALQQPASHAVKTSSAFSSAIAKGTAVSNFWNQAEEVLGKKASNGKDARPLVIDTCVLVAGLFASQNDKGISKRLMEQVLERGIFVPQVTWEIIDEYQKMFFTNGDHDLHQLLDLLSRSNLVPRLPGVDVPEVMEDPSDTPFLEALAQSIHGLADDKPISVRLVTWDHHLLNMAAGKDLDASLRSRIVTPPQILQQLPRK